MDKEPVRVLDTMYALLQRLETIENKFEATAWKRKHQGEIDALGGEKGAFMARYFEKLKELR